MAVSEIAKRNGKGSGAMSGAVVGSLQTLRRSLTTHNGKVALALAVSLWIAGGGITFAAESTVGGVTLVYNDTDKKVSEIKLGEIAWSSGGTVRNDGAEYSFSNATINTTNFHLTFADDDAFMNINSTDELKLIGNTSDWVPAYTKYTHSTYNYAVSNGVKLNATVVGSIIRLLDNNGSKNLYYHNNTVTINSVDLAEWNGTTTDFIIPTDWNTPPDVNATGFTAPALSLGDSVTILRSGKTSYFKDNNITGTHKYTTSAFTPSTVEGVTFSGAQSKGVTTDYNGTALVYKVSKYNVDGIFFGDMTWNTGRTAESDYDFKSVTAINVDNLKFSTPESVAKDASMTLLSNATNLAAGDNIAHTREFTQNAANGAIFTATLSGNVIRTTAGQIGYTATGTTLDSVDLSSWDSTKDAAAVPAGWTAKSGGVSVTGDGLTAPTITPGTYRNILTAATDNYFSNAQIADAIQYKTEAQSSDTANGVTLTGAESKGVKASEDGTSLVYERSKFNVSDISFGKMTWCTGRRAATVYDFANTATVNASGLSFNFTDEQKAALSNTSTMTLLSDATNLAAGKAVTGNVTGESYNHKQAVAYSVANGAALTGTLTGTVATAADAVNYNATGMTLDSVNLKEWDNTKDAVAVPTGWTANTSGVAVATENMTLPSLAAGTTKEILTTDTADFFSDDKISETNKYKAYDFAPVAANGVTLSGKQSRGVKTSDDKSDLVYAVGKMDVSDVSFGTMDWGTGRDATSEYDFTGATVDVTNLKFSTPESVAKDASMTLLSSATNLAVEDNIAHTQEFKQSKTNGAKLTATLSGNVIRTTAEQIGYTATGTTLDSVDLSSWDSTKDAVAIPAGWTANTSGVAVATENMKNLPELAAGTTKEILTTGTANYFSDDKISETNKYKAYDFTPSAANGVTLSGKQSRGVKISEDKSDLVYAVGKMDVSDLSFATMDWGTGRDATSEYDFAGATVDVTNLKFSTPESVAKDASMTLLSSATNLAAGDNIAHTQEFTQNAANGAVLSATLSGNVIRTTTGQIGYTATGTTLDSVNLSGWNSTKDAVAVPTGWTANASGVTVATENMTLPSLEAGTTKEILTTGTANFFSDDKISETNKYKEYNFTPSAEKGVTLSGKQSKGVKTSEDKSDLVYAVGKMDVSDISFGAMDWEKGRAATADYDFAAVATVNVSNLAFNFTDEQKAALSNTSKMLLLSDATNLAADKTVTGNVTGESYNHKQAVAYSVANGAALNGTLSGTVATAAGAVNYNATGMTLDSVNLKDWDSTKDVVAVPTGWTANASGMTVATENMTNLPELAAGKTKEILTTSTANYFSDDTISETNKYKAYDFAPSAVNGVTLSGKQSRGVRTAENGKKLEYAVGKMNVSDISFGAMDWGTGRAATADYDFATVATVNASNLSFNFTDEQKVGLSNTSAMTLLSDATNLAADKMVIGNVTGESYNHKQAVAYSVANGAALTGTLTGTVATVAGAVNYTASGMTLDSVDLAKWDSTKDAVAVPTGWTANASGVTVETNGMTVPTVAAGKHVDILQSDTDHFFANAKINGDNAYKPYNFTEKENSITFAVSQSRGVTLNTEQNHLIYAAGPKDVQTATLSGDITWSDGGVHYTNKQYTFSDASQIVFDKDAAFTATADPLNQSMTLIKADSAGHAVKGTVSGTPGFTVKMNNTSLDATVTGAASIESGNLKYTVTGVTLNKVTVDSVGSDAVPAGWSTAADVQVDTESMTVPTDAAYGQPQNIMTSDKAVFDDSNITGSNKYGENPAAFTDTDSKETPAVKIEGTQDAGVKASADGKSLLYEVGKKEASAISLGTVTWAAGSQLMDGSREEYDYSSVKSVDTGSFAVNYDAPQNIDVSKNKSMTLLQANDTLKAIVDEEKKQAYSYTPVTGVTMDANIIGRLTNNSGAVTYAPTANKAVSLIFGDVDWLDSGALIDHKTTLTNVSFDGAAVDTTKINFTNKEFMEVDKQMTLVSDFGGKPGSITGSKYRIGTGFEGEGSASMEDGNLIFKTKTGAGVSEQTHKTVMAMEADVALLNAGSEHIDNVMTGLGDPANMGEDGTSTMASVGGGGSRYETGSHVSSHTWNAAVGVGRKRELDKGTLEYGIFGEYGKSSYTLHSDAGKGDGDSHHAGGGLFAKWTSKHDVYTEASFRLGRMSNSTRDILTDGVNNYGYDVHATYYGAHVGVGKIFRYNGGKSLDVYGKFFYTKRNGVNFADRAGQQYNLDGVASSILRIGARYGTNDKKWNWYGGLAYEYEFDGEATGTVNGAAVRAASIKGGSGRAEIGMRMNATKTNPWKADISIYGYAGKHRGFGGSVSVAYMF